MDHTGAALAGIAPDMSASFTECFADEINEQGIVRHISANKFAVERKIYAGHVFTFSMSFFAPQYFFHHAQFI